MNQNNRDVQHFVTWCYRLRRVPETSSIVRSLLVLGLGLLFSISGPVYSDAAPIMEKQLTSSPVPETLQPQQPNPPFDVQAVIEKSEHFIESDPDQAGHYRVEDPAYHVDFFPEGFIYHPKWDGEPSYQKGIRIRVQSIGSSISLDDSAVTVHENRIVYQRTPAVQEVYEARKEGVEQSWIIQHPFADLSGDLTIRGEVETVLSALPNTSGGIDFIDRDGRYVTTYGQVTVIDRSGKKLTVSPVLKGATLSITVPSDWLAKARYPIVVDPLIGSSIRVDTLTTTDNYPAIAFDGTNYLIVWQTGAPNANGTGSTAIRGARVSTAGTVLDATPFTIGNQTDTGCTTTCDDEFPSVAYDSVNSRYIVVWMQWDDTAGSVTSANIWRNTVTTAGAVGTATKILDGGSRIFAYPSLACCDVNNNYYVVYGYGTNNGTNFTAFRGQTYNRNTHAAATGSNPSGTVSSGTITPNVAPIAAPRLYSLSTTKYLLAWETFVSGSNYDVNANIVTVSTTPSYTWGTAIAVANATTGTLVERYPRAAYDGTTVLIAFHKGTTTDADIYGRLGNPSGTSLTFGAAAFSISVVSGSNQTNPSVAYSAGTCSANPVNRYLVVWQDGRNNATNPDIYGVPVDTAGAVGTAVAVASATTYVKQYPVIAATDGGCSLMAAWSDTRNSGTASNDIYAQQIGYPNIANVSPVQGAAGQTAISINGLNFGADPGAGNRSTVTHNIKLNTTQVPDADVTFWSDTAITFTIPTGTTPGSYPVSVTAGNWTSNNNQNLTVQAVGAATQLVFTTQPGGGTGGTPWTIQPEVTIRDANGYTVTTATNAVTLAIGTNPNGGTLTCASNTVNAVNGVAAFTGCRIDKAGTAYTLTASAAGLGGDTSSTFNITVGPPALLAFTTQPADDYAGSIWTVQPVVAVQDAGGNTVTTATNSVTLAIGANPGSGTLTCTTNPLTASAGVAVFSGCRINNAGNGYTLTASAAGLTGTTSVPFNITAGIQITTGSLSVGHQWINYSAALSVSGGISPYNWSVVVGSLPSGLTLNALTGMISGTPDTFGTFNFTIQVTDSTAPTALTDTQAYSLTIYGLNTIDVTPANPSITPGQTIQFTATGTYSDSNVNDLTNIVAWNTNNLSVATIDASGLATGVGLGAVTVSAIK